MPDLGVSNNMEKAPAPHFEAAGSSGRASEQAVERGADRVVELQAQREVAIPTAEEDIPVGSSLVAATQLANEYKEREKKIEKIMEENLAELYAGLSTEKKQEFKTAGERTAEQINQLLSGAKVQLKKIIALIVDWLKIIPGANRFFLEQEAKIKADEIIKLSHKEGR